MKPRIVQESDPPPPHHIVSQCIFLQLSGLHSFTVCVADLADDKGTNPFFFVYSVSSLLLTLNRDTEVRGGWDWRIRSSALDAPVFLFPGAALVSVAWGSLHADRVCLTWKSLLVYSGWKINPRVPDGSIEDVRVAESESCPQENLLCLKTLQSRLK